MMTLEENSQFLQPIFKSIHQLRMHGTEPYALVRAPDFAEHLTDNYLSSATCLVVLTDPNAPGSTCHIVQRQDYDKILSSIGVVRLGEYVSKSDSGVNGSYLRRALSDRFGLSVQVRAPETDFIGGPDDAEIVAILRYDFSVRALIQPRPCESITLHATTDRARACLRLLGEDGLRRMLDEQPVR